MEVNLYVKQVKKHPGKFLIPSPYTAERFCSISILEASPAPEGAPREDGEPRPASWTSQIHAGRQLCDRCPCQLACTSKSFIQMFLE